MKTRTGFSLRIGEQGAQVLQVETAQDKPYRLESVEAVDATPNGPLTRAWTKPSARVMQFIEGHEVHLMLTALPALKAKALTAAMQGAVVRDKGGRPGDWVLSHRRLEAVGSHADANRLEMCITHAPLDVVGTLFAQALRFGARPLGMLPDFLALEELYRRHGVQEEDEGAWALIHLGKADRFLCVGDDECLVLERPLPEDLSSGRAPDEYLDHLITEIERSVSFAQQSERSLQIGRIVICGDPQLSVRLRDRLADRNDIQVRHWCLEDIFETDDDRPVWPHILDLARAVAAIHGSRWELLPPGVKRGPGVVLRRQALVALTTAMLVGLPLAFIGNWMTSRAQTASLDQAALQQDLLQDRAQEAARFYVHNSALEEREANVERLSRAQPDLSGLMRDLASRTPASVTLSTLEVECSPQRQWLLVLRGESRARTGEIAQQVFLDFLQALRDSPRLQELGEPSYLELAGIEEARQPRSRVSFTLKYIVREEAS